MLTPVRFVVADDHEVVRDGIALLAGRDSSVTLVGTARNAHETCEVVAATHPDVLLLDLRLPDALATETMQQLRSLGRVPKVIVFTAFDGHAALASLLKEGIDGFLIKDATGIDIIRAIKRVAAGETVIDPRLAGSVPPLNLPSGVKLTPREYQVLRRMAMGETNPEISEVLNLSRNTVKTYLQTAFQKLGARNRVDAISKATELGLL